MVYIEPYNSTWLVAGGGVFLALPAGAIVYSRRRKRPTAPLGDSVDALLDEESFDMMEFPDGEDEMAERLSRDEDFHELCDQLFRTEGESTDEGFWKPSAEECLAEDECPPMTSPTSLSNLVTLPRVRSTPAERETSNSAASTTALSPPSRVPVTETADTAPAAELNRPGRSARRWWLASLGLLIWAAVLALCLHKGVTPTLATKPIEQFQVGMIVPGDKIRGDNDLRYGEKVDPKTWRHLFVEGTKADGSRWDADLLMPPEWLEEQQARVGGEVYVTVPECGIDGDARVVSLGPCPDIPDLTANGLLVHNAIPCDIDIVLGHSGLDGSERQIRNFAKARSGLYFRNWFDAGLTTADDFSEETLEQAMNQARHIHIDLAGILDDGKVPMALRHMNFAPTSFREAVAKRQTTIWEIMKVRGNRKWFNKAKFYDQYGKELTGKKLQSFLDKLWL